MKFRVLLLLLLVLGVAVGLTACYPPAADEGVAGQARLDFTGKILEVRQASPQDIENGLLGAILVEGTIQEGAQDALVSSAVIKDTRLWMQDGQTRQPITFDALVAGQSVQIAFRGPLAESYPMQGTADEIVVTP
ncbi:MAG TPA: DUF3221 domain-containing protein [Anaerolineae bacterium]|nr:DUF3221 domain-containing protein [Anaerolineae bacterium]